MNPELFPCFSMPLTVMWPRGCQGSGILAAPCPRSPRHRQKLMGDHGEPSLDCCAPHWAPDLPPFWLCLRNGWAWGSVPATSHFALSIKKIFFTS